MTDVAPVGEASEEVRRSGPRWLTRAAISVVLVVMTAWVLSGAADRMGHGYVDQGLKRALITFAVARTLNGVIAVVKSTELAIQPAGVGVRFAPAAVLEPINDLIERFSWVMLASSTSLGMQKIMLTVLGWSGWSMLILGLATATLVLLWLPRRASPIWLERIGKALVVALVIRLAIPVFAMVSETIYDAFLQPEYESALTSLRHVSLQLEEIAPLSLPMTAAPDSDESLLDRARNWLGTATDSLRLGDRVEAYKTALSDASEHTVSLIVVFVLQTALLPLVFLWLLMRGTRWLIRL
ncbi:MAG: hypothetical protein ACFCUJ_12495 [Thiotrichales bacterium]